MNFNNFNTQRNSNTLTLDDNDLLDDEWLYTSEPFNRTDTFRRKVKNEGDTSRNSILEWLATDDEKINEISTDNNIALEDTNRKKNKTDSINLFDDNKIFNNSDSLFEDDLDISNLDSRFMSNFKLVSQDDFEDTDIEESLTKNNTSPDFHRCDSPNTEINLMDTNKIGNNETINIEDNDSDSNMTIINTSCKNKIESLNEVEKNSEIVNIEKFEIEKINENSNEFKTNESESSVSIDNSKSNLLKKSELAQKRFLAKVEEAKKTLENLKPRKDSLSSSENDLITKTPKLEEKEKHDNNEEKTFNKKKIERRSYYYYADTGSDDEKDDKNSSIINSRKSSFDINDKIHSDSFKKTFNYFNSGNADSSFYGDNIYNTNESSFISLPPTHMGNRYSEDFEDYPRKPPAPSLPNNGALLTNLIDHSNFESQIYQADIETESNSSFHSDIRQPEYYINQSFSNYGNSKSSLGYYSTSPRSPILKSNNLYTSSLSIKPNTSFIPTSPTIKANTSFIPTSPTIKANTSFIPISPTIKANTSFIPTSPTIKANTSFIPTSPTIKANTSFIPTSPTIKANTSFIPTSPTIKATTSYIPTSPNLKANNPYRPSSPTIGKYSSSIHNKKSNISSPRIGYSSPSPTPYSKSYENRTYDPVAPTYSIKDLINNKTPQVLSHSGSINSVSSMSSSSTYKPSNSYSRKTSLEQTPQLKNYLNKMATTQRSKSPSVLSTSSTSSSKYSSGRKTPNSRLGSHYAESTASSTSSSSKIYSKYKSTTSSSSSSIPKIGSGIPSSAYTKGSSSSIDNNKSKLSTSYGKSLYSSDISSSSSKNSYSNGSYSGRLSKTPTPSSSNKHSIESRIPSPSPYSKRSITPYY